MLKLLFQNLFGIKLKIRVASGDIKYVQYFINKVQNYKFPENTDLLKVIEKRDAWQRKIKRIAKQNRVYSDIY